MFWNIDVKEQEQDLMAVSHFSVIWFFKILQQTSREMCS